MTFNIRWAVLVVELFLTFQSGLVQAQLGGGVDSIESDRKVLKAQMSSGKNVTSRSHSQFSVTEMIIAGVKVREYVSHAGIVFGIAWTGSHHINYSALLGSYQAEHETAFKANRAQIGLHRGLRARAIHSENVHVDLEGHFRSMRGRAYSPALLPSGVNANEIQ
jgi:hypothetical protein